MPSPSQNEADPEIAGTEETKNADAMPAGLGRKLAMATVFGVLVTAGLMVYGDIDAVGDQLASFNWMIFYLAIILSTANYLIRYVRWEIYLRSLDIVVPPPSSFIIFFSGFVMSITPGKVGEVFKSLLLKQAHDVAIERSAPIVLAERLTDLIALVILALLGSIALAESMTVAAVGGGLVLLGLLMITVRPIGLMLVSLIGKLPLLRRVEPKLLAAYESLYVLVRPKPLILTTLLATGAWFLEAIALLLIIGNFPYCAISESEALFAYAVPTIVGAVAMLPGGLGATEASMTGILVSMSDNITVPIATAATIFTRLATLWWAVLLGAAALIVFRSRMDRK